ncbi:hypothetical protein ACQPZF_40245 [Actinosynnema sp. CS-041913]|uniref:hypothetical protein n=1 Tax=Actinosynnema sp. CS-041913 TaxID=3239917 RepID=UPI003D8B2FF6
MSSQLPGLLGLDEGVDVAGGEDGSCELGGGSSVVDEVVVVVTGAGLAGGGGAITTVVVECRTMIVVVWLALSTPGCTGPRSTLRTSTGRGSLTVITMVSKAPDASAPAIPAKATRLTLLIPISLQKAHPGGHVESFHRLMALPVATFGRMESQLAQDGRRRRGLGRSSRL